MSFRGPLRGLLADLYLIVSPAATPLFASDFLLLVQKKVTKEKDTRAGADMCRSGLFALSDFDSPSWLSKIGHDVRVALLDLFFSKKTCPPRTSTWD